MVDGDLHPVADSVVHGEGQVSIYMIMEKRDSFLRRIQKKDIK